MHYRHVKQPRCMEIYLAFTVRSPGSGAKRWGSLRIVSMANIEGRSRSGDGWDMNRAKFE